MNIKSLAMRGYIKWKERTYDYQGHKLKYILRGNNPNLVIVFSAFSVGGGTPTYNYIRTFMPIKNASFLFILDDLIEDFNPGSFYLGSDGDFWGINAVTGLIESQRVKIHADKLFMVGSSKGATAAIMFGIKMNADLVIAGAPQYYIGSYLNCDAHRHLLPKLLGNDPSIEDLELLDNIIPDILADNQGNGTRIALHYSEKEHTYIEHIAMLLSDLKRHGYKVEEDVRDYQSHDDVKYFFPQYLLNRLRQELAH